jgi:DNA-3-methyladenine glycosylase II
MPQALINTEADLEDAIVRLVGLDPRFDHIVALTGTPPLRRREGGFAGLN